MSAPGIGPGPTLWKSAILTTILRGRFPHFTRYLNLLFNGQLFKHTSSA
jgi:hypothetical protein